MMAIDEQAYHILHIKSDGAGWVLDHEAEELGKIASALDIPFVVNGCCNRNVPQCIHDNQLALYDERIYEGENRISIDYFNALSADSFIKSFDALCKHHHQITRIRVPHSEVETLVLSSGISPDKVFRIPIGIQTAYFQKQSDDKKKEMREFLGIPCNALVVGSFQKDGVGWEEGLEPKLIKGPDVFVETLVLLKKKLPNIWVLLTGAARGYVKRGLEQAQIPYTHRFLKSYREIATYYQALDLYLITAREEGGPKGLLEAMVSGVPVVTTRCGQAIDLVAPDVNAWMVPLEDREALAEGAYVALTDGGKRSRIIENGYNTAYENAYERQIPLWKEFFKGYVEC